MKFLDLDLDFEFPSQEVVDLLLEDYKRLKEIFDSDPEDQAVRRSLVRSALALTEALTDFLKQVSYNFATGVLLPLQQHIGALKKHCPIRLIAQEITHTELALLRDEVSRISEHGELVSSVVYPDYKKNVKFVVKELIKIFGLQIPDQFFQSKGWQALLDSTDLRNKLMHPKKLEELEVSDEQLLRVATGTQWMLDTYAELLSDVGDAAEAAEVDCIEWIQSIEPELKEELSEILQNPVSSGTAKPA